MNLNTLSISKTLSLFFLTMMIGSAPAHAHWGHLGELAGHSHVIGLGALVAAGVAAAVIAKWPRKEIDDTEAKDQDSTEEAALDGEQPA